MITEYFSKNMDINDKTTRNNRKKKIIDFLKKDVLTGYRVTETQNSIFSKLRDGLQHIHRCLESPKNL